eukprot:TRINITY_DN54792_c0_g1_i1.p2 TRINITY_DN54792_c0_g1~~TRINITY_DN54792_c0_g1_i1.p2  ORF type:complete len:282 (-),score=138.46 TRINITY_DN54792_c0_g1_i1:58-873(-)
MSAAIRDVFKRCGEQGRAAFVPYVTAGFPTPKDTVPLLLSLERAGADVIELGVPFSDPLADGGTIQEANTLVLDKYNISYKDCLGFVAAAREAGLKTPIVLMGYINPLLAFGQKEAVAQAKQAGANGFIVVDLPWGEHSDDEDGIFVAECRAHGLSVVPLLAPTTRDLRIKLLTEAADSFVYCVSVAGVTGARKSVNKALPEFLARIREHTDKPLAVGFGISTREHYQNVEKMGANAVVIGSAVIKTITAAEQGKECDAIEKYVRTVMGKE